MKTLLSIVTSGPMFEFSQIITFFPSFTFDFKNKKTASLKNFYQEKEISDDILNCEFEGVLGTTASIVGTTQANEALKMLMEIGQNLKNQILIIDLLNLNFRKVKFRKK